MRVEWRFALMESGEQFAMTTGMIMMLPLFVDNLDTRDVSHYNISKLSARSIKHSLIAKGDQWYQDVQCSLSTR